MPSKSIRTGTILERPLSEKVRRERVCDVPRTHPLGNLETQLFFCHLSSYQESMESDSYGIKAHLLYFVCISPLFEESQTEGSEHQDDAYVRHESFPESVPKEQEVDADDNNYQSHDTCGKEYWSCH